MGAVAGDAAEDLPAPSERDGKRGASHLWKSRLPAGRARPRAGRPGAWSRRRLRQEELLAGSSGAAAHRDRRAELHGPVLPGRPRTATTEGYAMEGEPVNEPRTFTWAKHRDSPGTTSCAS